MARVLVVDDDEANRESLYLVLADLGYDVAVASSAQAGVDILLKSPGPMVVVFDYFMPELTGGDMLRIAERDVPFVERHAFICVTASPHRVPEHVTTWLAQRGTPVISKPYEVDELLAVVAREAARVPVTS
jgi:CheY-like chemotaxis protein